MSKIDSTANIEIPSIDEERVESLNRQIGEWLKKANVKAKPLPFGHGWASIWNISGKSYEVVLGVSSMWIAIKAPIINPLSSTSDIEITEDLKDAILAANWNMCRMVYSMDSLTNGIWCQADILSKSATPESVISALSAVIQGIYYFVEKLVPDLKEITGELKSQGDNTGKFYV